MVRKKTHIKIGHSDLVLEGGMTADMKHWTPAGPEPPAPPKPVALVGMHYEVSETEIKFIAAAKMDDDTVVPLIFGGLFYLGLFLQAGNIYSLNLVLSNCNDYQVELIEAPEPIEGLDSYLTADYCNLDGYNQTYKLKIVADGVEFIMRDELTTQSGYGVLIPIGNFILRN